ncbi:Plant UBX domain-containing protein 12 [Hirschfeldia incana]|nr:Plant UBX domain-containing protein 12 [Hirschfeldia incana]
MAKRLFAVLECQSLLENLSPFVETKRPRNSTDDAESPTCVSPNSVIGFPELTEEPRSDSDRSALCRLCVRLPDGRKVQRNFLRSESVQLLWSFCYSLIDESERRERSFKLIQAVPGDYKSLYYGSETSFGESGLDNSLISVIWV